MNSIFKSKETNTHFISKDKFTIRKKSNLYIPEGNITYVLSFFIPLIIFIAIYYLRDIYPFGNNCYLRSDMYHQYAPFYSELWNKLRNNESLSYTWNTGMGTNFTSLYAYYLASPVNYIIALFPQEYLIEIMDLLIIIKLSAASLAFTYYLSKHFHTKSCVLSLFGMFYGLSAYAAAYSWNIMWLDCIILVPLIMLGLEKLVNENKCMLYCVSLGLCILTNYYISIMVCLSCCLYFVVLLIINTDKNKNFKFYIKTFFIWVFYSLLAAGLSACLLLPEIYAFSLSASSDVTFPAKLSSYFSVLEMITRQLINIPVHLGLDHLPNIYCGVFVFLLITIYLSVRKIPAKEKISKLMLLAVFLFSFNLNIPNFVWHGLHYPNSLPCRQSYIYIFFLLSICCEAFLHLKETSSRNLTTALWVSLGLLVLIEQIFTTTQKSTYSFKSVYLSGIFILLYALIMLLYIKKKMKVHFLMYILFATCIIECTVNMEETGFATTNRTAFLSDYSQIQDVKKTLDEKDNSFYRMEKLNNARSKNDGAWHNFKSISTFSSTSNAGMSDLLGLLGFEHSTNAYGFNGSTKVTESLFSIKYLINNQKQTDTPLTTLNSTVSNAYIYENNYTLPIGYLVDSDINTSWQPYESNNGIMNQNSLIEATTGISNVFTLTCEINSESPANITPIKNGYMYLVVNNPATDSISVTISGKSQTFSGLKDENHIINLGYIKTDDVIEVSSTTQLELKAYTLETSRFIEAYNILNNNALQIENYSDTSINGTINASYDGSIMFSIPYDAGWDVYIDGQKADTYAIKNALLSVNISAGEHDISLKYTPVNLVKGCIITIICIIILVAVSLLKQHNMKLTWSETFSKIHIKKPVRTVRKNNISVDKTDSNTGTDTDIDIESILDELDDFENIDIMDNEVEDELQDDSPYGSDTY